MSPIMWKFTTVGILLLCLSLCISGRVSPISNSESCPAGCSCRSQDTGIITACMNQGFSRIPDDVSNNTSGLYLQGNKITQLEDGVFDDYSSLYTIVLTDSGIRNIQPGAFNNLEDLTSLDLRDNKIKILRSYIFSSLKKLERIILDGNRIRVIESYAFAGTGRLYEGVSLSLEMNLHLHEIQPHAFEGAKIEELYIKNSSLSNNSLECLQDLKSSLFMLFISGNKIPLSFPADLFRGFVKLKTLNLDNNRISNADFLQDVTASDISLSNNPIGVVDFSQFIQFTHIRSFQISNTGFNSVKPEYFKNMPQLSQLYIDGNGITKLSTDAKTLFSRLELLSLVDNNLHCNCDTLWLKQWITSGKTQVIGAECNSPFKTPIRSADVSLFACSPPTSVVITRQFEKGEVSLICTSNGDPLPNITWTDPQGRSFTAQPNKLSGKTKALLKIQDSDTSGFYTCKSENTKGNKISTISINVYETITLARSQNNVGNTGHQNNFTIHMTIILICSYMLWC